MLGLLNRKNPETEGSQDPTEEQLRPRKSRKSLLPRQQLESLVKRFRKKQPLAEESHEQPVGRTMFSTQHNQWIRKAVGIGVIAAVACGPVALYQISQDEPVQPPQTVESGTNAGELSAHDRAGAFGTMVVSKWLTATRADSEELDKYFADSSAKGFETTPMEIDRPSVVSATKDKSGLWSVVVAVDTKSTEKVKGKDDKTTWTTRHFELPVRVEDSGEAIAQRAPAMVPLPAQAEGETFAYGEDLSPSGGISAMSGEFLNALLVGTGDVSRLTTPGSDITPIEPAAFTSVTVSKVQATQPEAEAPMAGDANEILVTAVGKTESGEGIPLQYSISILSRDGRWEVKSLSRPPALETSDASTAPPTEPPTTSPGAADPTQPNEGNEP